MTTVVQVAFSHTHRHRTPPPVGRSVYMDFKGVGQSIIQSTEGLSPQKVNASIGLHSKFRSCSLEWHTHETSKFIALENMV